MPQTEILSRVDRPTFTFDARTADMLAVVCQIQAEGGSSLRAIAAELHTHGVLTPAGKPQWSAAQVRRLMAAQ